MQRLAEKKAVITGAAQGLGQALAQRMSDEGAQIVIGDINIEGAKETAFKLNGGAAFQLDVTAYSSCEAFIKAAVEHLGGIDILISNAAILISGAIEEFNSEKWKEVIDINLCGFYNIAKA